MQKLNKLKLRLSVFAAIAAVFVLGSAAPAEAQVNSTLHFQGKIVNKTTGTNLVTGTPSCVVSGAGNDTCDFRVSIYSDPTSGTLLWQEVHQNLELGARDGVFDLALNSVCNQWGANASPATDCTGTPTASGITWGADSTIYIQIEFAPAGSMSFTETFERKLFTSVPYAYYADSAGSLGGISANGFVQIQPASANTVKLNVLKGLGSSGAEQGWIVRTAADGSFFLGGEAASAATIDFDEDRVLPGDTVSTTAAFGFFVRYDKNGRFLWYKKINGTTAVRNIQLDSSGNIYVVGSFNGTSVDFDEDNVVSGDTHTTAGNTDAFIAKYNSSGVLQWVKTPGGTGGDSTLSVAIDGSGNVYAAGSATGTGTIDFDEDNVVGDDSFAPSASGSGYFVKYNSSGVLQWLKGYLGTSSLSIANSVSMVGSEIAVTGTMFGTSMDFDDDNSVSGDTLSSAGGTDIFIAKYDSAGLLQWVKALGGTGTTETGNGVTSDSSNNIFVVGSFTSASVDFDEDNVVTGDTYSSAGNTDIFLAKYNNSGVLQWVNTPGNTAAEQANGVAVDSTGAAYIVGTFASTTVDFNESAVVTSDTVTLQGGTDIFIAKYSSSGTLAWTKGVGGASSELGNSINLDFTDSVLIAGIMAGSSLDMDDDYVGTLDIISSAGSNDFFVAKYVNPGQVVLGSSTNSLINIDYTGVNTPDLINLKVGGTEVFSVLSNGNVEVTGKVGVRLANPDEALDVLGNIQLSSNGSTAGNLLNTGGSSNIGTSSRPFANAYVNTYYGQNLSIQNFDVAEEYEVEDTSIAAGDVVRFKPQADNSLLIERAGGQGKAYDTDAIGVISTAPGLYLKDWEANKKNGRPVALAGRVPVKVTLENGDIQRGDLLTASSTPGYAMKATEGGQIIGRAMEDFVAGAEGDSKAVKRQINEDREEGKELVEKVLEEEKISGQTAKDALAVVADQVKIVPAAKPLTGRIMMYVNSGYRSQQAIPVEVISSTSRSIAGFFGLLEADTMLLNSNFEVKGDIKVAGALRAEDLLAASAEGMLVSTKQGEKLFAVDGKGKLSLGQSSGSSLGQIEVNPGDKTVEVEHKGVTEKSRIFLTPISGTEVGVSIAEIQPGKGFSINISAAEELDSPWKLQYLIVN
jgi:hypothetical protein